MANNVQCMVCDFDFSSLIGLRSHLFAEHGFDVNKANAQVKEWLKSKCFDKPEKEQCTFCGFDFSCKYILQHVKSCAPKHQGESPAGEAIAAYLAASSGAAARSAPQPEVVEGVLGKRSEFHSYLCQQGTAKKVIDRHMSIYDQWVEFCEGDDSLTTMEWKLVDFIKEQPNDTSKGFVFNTYQQFVSFEHKAEGKSGKPSVVGRLEDGEFVFSGEPREFHSRPRADPSAKEDDGQPKGKGCRVKSQTQFYTVTEPLRAGKKARAKPWQPQAPVPMDVEPSTSNTQTGVGDQPTTSRGQQQLASDVVKVVRGSRQIVRIPLGTPKDPRDSSTGEISRRAPAVIPIRIKGPSVHENPSPMTAGIPRPQVIPLTPTAAVPRLNTPSLGSSTGAVPKRTPTVIPCRIKGPSVAVSPTPGTFRPMTPAGAAPPPVTPSPGTPRPLVISLTPAASNPGLERGSLGGEDYVEPPHRSDFKSYLAKVEPELVKEYLALYDQWDKLFLEMNALNNSIGMRDVVQKLVEQQPTDCKKEEALRMVRHLRRCDYQRMNFRSEPPIEEMINLEEASLELLTIARRVFLGQK